MIRLTRLNHIPMMLNSDLIEHLEVTPDTVITLTTGQKFMVLESAEDVRDRVVEFRRAIYARMCQYPAVLQADAEPTTAEEPRRDADGR